MRLAEHRRGVVADPGRGDRRVELVGVGAPGLDDLLGAGERVGQHVRAVRGQAHPRPRRTACRHDEAEMGGHLGPTAIEVDGRRAVQHVVGDAVLRVRRRVLGAPETGGVGLVVAEQQLGVLGRVQVHHAELVVLGAGHRSALDPLDLRRRGVRLERPRVAEPHRRQQMDRRVLGPAVVHVDAAEQVVRPGLGVGDLDVEVAVLVEDAGVEQLVLHLEARARAVRVDEVGVRERRLRVLVQPALVRVRRQVVDEEVVLLDVLAVVALAVGQPVQALLEDGVLLVPHGQGEAQALVLVADPGEAVLAPAVGA